MKKIKLLAVVPYEGMRIILEQITEKYPELEMYYVFGGISEIERITAELALVKPDVVIARGLVAHHLLNYSNIPVVEVDVSGYDMLSAIRTAMEYNTDFAVLGYKKLTDGAAFICNLLKYNVPIVTVETAQDYDASLQAFQQKGIHLVVGGMLTAVRASQYGMGGIIVTSGPQSLEAAVNHAISLHRASERRQLERKALRQSLTDNGSRVLLTDGSVVLYDSASAPSEEAAKVVQYVMHFPDEPVIIKNEGKEYHSLCRTFTENPDLKVISLQKLSDESVSVPINIYNLSGTVHSPSVIYSAESPMQEILSLFVQCENNAFILKGEPGTEFSLLGNFICRTHLGSEQSMISVRFSQGNTQNVIRKIESITAQNGYYPGLFLEDIDYLGKQELKKLLSVLPATQLIILCCKTDFHAQQCSRVLDECKRTSLIANIPPLRERSCDVQGLLNMYIMDYNLKSPRKIIGMDGQAIIWASTYPWPGNAAQVSRASKAFCTQAVGLYITVDELRHAVESCEIVASPCNAKPVLDNYISLEGTLRDITARAIIAVLQQENGNKARTAERLDISRGKIWSLLKEYSPN